MKKRLTLLLGVAVALLLVGYLALWLTAPSHRVNADSFEKLKIGMTRTEAEAIFGVPPGNYCSGQVDFDIKPLVRLDPPTRDVWNRQKHVTIWSADWATVAVGFDEEDKITNATFKGMHPSGNVLAHLRRWLGVSN